MPVSWLTPPCVRWPAGRCTVPGYLYAPGDGGIFAELRWGSLDGSCRRPPRGWRKKREGGGAIKAAEPVAFSGALGAGREGCWLAGWLVVIWFDSHACNANTPKSRPALGQEKKLFVFCLVCWALPAILASFEARWAALWSLQYLMSRCFRSK